MKVLIDAKPTGDPREETFRFRANLYRTVAYEDVAIDIKADLGRETLERSIWCGHCSNRDAGGIVAENFNGIGIASRE